MPEIENEEQCDSDSNTLRVVSVTATLTLLDTPQEQSYVWKKVIDSVLCAVRRLVDSMSCTSLLGGCLQMSAMYRRFVLGKSAEGKQVRRTDDEPEPESEGRFLCCYRDSHSSPHLLPSDNAFKKAPLLQHGK